MAEEKTQIDVDNSISNSIINNHKMDSKDLLSSKKDNDNNKDNEEKSKQPKVILSLESIDNRNIKQEYIKHENNISCNNKEKNIFIHGDFEDVKVSIENQRENIFRNSKLCKLEERNSKSQIETVSSINHKSDKLYPIRIAITGFSLEKSIIDKLEKIGIIITDKNQYDFKSIVLKFFKRTVKLLFAINKGIPIIRFDWLNECIRLESIVNNADFLFEYSIIEDKMQFSIQDSVKIALDKFPKGVFDEYLFWMPKKGISSYEELKIVITSGGGYLLEEKFKNLNDLKNYGIVSVNKMEKQEYIEKGYKICSEEDIYMSSLKQNSEYIGRLLKKK